MWKGGVFNVNTLKPSVCYLHHVGYTWNSTFCSQCVFCVSYDSHNKQPVPSLNNINLLVFIAEMFPVKCDLNFYRRNVLFKGMKQIAFTVTSTLQEDWSAENRQRLTLVSRNHSKMMNIIRVFFYETVELQPSQVLCKYPGRSGAYLQWKKGNLTDFFNNAMREATGVHQSTPLLMVIIVPYENCDVLWNRFPSASSCCPKASGSTLSSGCIFSLCWLSDVRNSRFYCSPD
jgi:hypothetical protein